MLIDHGMMRRAAKGFVKGALASVMLASFAGATTITTTNFNTWKTATYLTGAPTELNFLAINASSYNTASGITLTGGASAATFAGLNSGSYSLAGDIYSKTLSGASSAGASINVAFANPQNAFLVSFANPSALQYTVTLSDGQIFNTTSRLIGFSVSHTISSLSIATTPGNQAVLNDFYFGVSALAQDAATPTPDPGTPAATPEPATIMLFAGGLLVMAGAKKRWVKAQS